MRSKETFDTIMKKPYYRSIIFLTLFYGNEKGLRPMDYRFILIKNQDGITKTKTDIIQNSTIIQKWVKIMLKDIKEKKYRYGMIVPECVTSKNNLSRILNKLVEDYNILVRSDENQIPFYKIKKDVDYKILKWLLMVCIEKFPDEYIDGFANDFFKIYLEKLEKENIDFIELLSNIY